MSRPPLSHDRSHSSNQFHRCFVVWSICWAVWMLTSGSKLLGKIRHKCEESGMIVLSVSPPTSIIKTVATTTIPSQQFIRLGKEQTLCSLSRFQVICRKFPRNITKIPSFPKFAEYYVDKDGNKVAWQATPERPISTNWFRPESSRTCGDGSDDLCANLGDELGPMLLLKLSGKSVIENRYDAMDVVVIGSVLNYIVANYGDTVKRVGHHNVTVWGTVTKWGVPGVCLDFKAVRGPKTRDAFMQHGCNVPEVYGDPALLFPFLHKPRKLQLPKVDLCLIPHIDDLWNGFPWWRDINGTSLLSRFTYLDHQLANSTKVVRVIDIRTPDAATFIDVLASCSLVASASLHGLILAEAYNVTWSWVRLREKHEAAFKYHDFFMSVGIDPIATNSLHVHSGIEVERIIEHTLRQKQYGPSLYDPIKLLDACPFCDAKIVQDMKESIHNQRGSL